MAAALDPGGSLFGQRVVTRTDCPDLTNEKRLQRVWPAFESTMALVVDDKDEMWPHDGANVIKVEPYVFWQVRRD